MVDRSPKSSSLAARPDVDRKSTRLNSSHLVISYAVFCLKKKKNPCEQNSCRLPGLHPPAFGTLLVACPVLPHIARGVCARHLVSPGDQIRTSSARCRTTC